MFEFPSEIKKAASALTSGGYEAYVVGGSLRNMLISKPPHDFDMTTSATPEEVITVFEPLGYHVIKTGIKHGTVTVLIGEIPIEITTFRIDGTYTDARHPDSISFTRNINEDLSRRDFTVNAMAADPNCKFDSIVSPIIDPYGGMSDLYLGLLRCVGDPQKRFSEDALRILRAFRFVSEHGFNIEENTYSAIISERDGLKKISRERIFSELTRIILGDNAERALSMMLDCGVMQYIFPTIDDLPSMQDITRTALVPKSLGVRLSALLFYTPNAVAALSYLKASNSLKREVAALLTLGEYAENIDKKTARALVFSLGELTDDAIALASALCNEALASSLRIAHSEKFPRSIKELAISGSDIIALGAVGSEIGTILSSLLDKVLECPQINERKELLTLAKELLKVNKNG